MDPGKLQKLFDLTGRVAIVTGGTRGIGRAIAEGFVAAGAKVVVASRRPEACAETEAHLIAMGGEALGVPTHLGELPALAALVRRTLSPQPRKGETMTALTAEDRFVVGALLARICSASDFADYVDPTFGARRSSATRFSGSSKARQLEVAFRQGIPLRLSEGKEPGNATRFPGLPLSHVLGMST